jgi:peptidoglycan hydrolase-like protein with peptidoglycan-binding domain
MPQPPTHDERTADTPQPPGPSGLRRPARLTVALMVAGGIALSTGCAGAASPAQPGAVLPPTGAPETPAPTAPEATSAEATTTEATTPAPVPAPQTAVPEAEPQVLRVGAEGPAVLEIQQRLSELGYWLGEVDGHYGQLTRQAVMAFQKAEGLTRDGIAGTRTRDRLPDASRPEPEHTDGDLIEVDLERQLLFVVRDGKLQWALNTSTGNGEAFDRPSGGTGVARTPRGEYEIERHINGIRNADLGVLYRPKYFHGGIAVHGSGSIPAQPASHGCVRVTNAAMDLLWATGVAEIGTEVIVH